jgi:hypothetical protein
MKHLEVNISMGCKLVIRGNFSLSVGEGTLVEVDVESETATEKHAGVLDGRPRMATDREHAAALGTEPHKRSDDRDAEAGVLE